MDYIEVSGLTKTFNKKKVLNNITFSVQKGEVFGFLGPNGAGKTTTMLILLGLLQPDSGSAEVMGAALGDNPDLRRKTGVVLEKPGMYSNLTASTNLAYFSRLYGIEVGGKGIEEMLERVGLGPAAEQKVGTFSTGMEKRLALARALLHGPKVLFLDEPTAGLDPEAQIEFRSTIKRLSEENDMTVFLNSHNLDEVQKICSSVAILDKGTVRAWDTLTNLQHRSGEPTVVVGIHSPEQKEAARALLEEDPAVDTVEEAVQEEGTVFACKLSGTDNFSLKQLVLADIQIDYFYRSTKTLEEVYMDIIKDEEQ